MNNRLTWAIIAVLVVAVAAGVLIYQRTQQAVEQKQAEAASSASLGGDIYESSQNPVKDKLPETNPFEGAKINPFAE